MILSLYMSKEKRSLKYIEVFSDKINRKIKKWHKQDRALKDLEAILPKMLKIKGLFDEKSYC